MMDTGNLASNTGEGPLWIIGSLVFLKIKVGGNHKRRVLFEKNVNSLEVEKINQKLQT